MEEIIKPATYAQVNYFWKLGLRERTLTLPVMMALVLSMIWRQISTVGELVRTVQRESMLWVTPRKLRPQAVSQRLDSLPAELFKQVLESVLLSLKQRWEERQRPVPVEIGWARSHYEQVAICDGSTLDALVRRLGLLREETTHPLAGRMTALLDLGSRLPINVWFDEDAQGHDLAFWPRILSALKAKALLIFDLGYTNFNHFADLTAREITFITRAKKNLSFQVERVLSSSADVHDTLVWIGPADNRQPMRLVEMLYRGLWYRYLTNELDVQRLPADMVVALYRQRWRIEDAYAIVKRLLGLAYFLSGSQNAIQLQLWATWILYAVLVDITDAVAAQLRQPIASISMEMVYRGLYHYTAARTNGTATDVILFLSEEAQSLGVLKRKRKPKRPEPEEDYLDRYMKSLTCD